MSKVVMIDDKKSIDVDVPEVIVHLSKMLDLVITSQKELPLNDTSWDDAYAYLSNYFEEMYCTLNNRDDIDEISAEFIISDKKDTQRGIEFSVSIVDFTKA
jgi:hypothetical protein